MKFILWLDPDTESAEQHLDFAFDSMSNGPLTWTIDYENGTTENLLFDASQRFAPDPTGSQWLGYARATTPATPVQFSDQDADQQLDWLLRAVTAEGADVNQRRYDLESIAKIVTDNPQAGYGRMPIDTDVHGPECIICRGVEDFTLNPPGRSRDGHPYVDMDDDENKDRLLITLPDDDTFYVGDLDRGIAAIKLDRFTTEGWVKNDSDERYYRVHLCDREPAGTEPTDADDVAEFGSGKTREEAWRYALGAAFGPIDAEYDEDGLRKGLFRHLVHVKPEFEHLLTAAVTMWDGGNEPHDWDRPEQEYLRGQVELLVQAGAVEAPEDYDFDAKKEWLTSHLITRIINANAKGDV